MEENHRISRLWISMRLASLSSVLWTGIEFQNLCAQTPYVPLQQPGPPANQPVRIPESVPQPSNPAQLGGLPSGGSGLEQPVFIANRSLGPDSQYLPGTNGSELVDSNAKIIPNPTIDYARFEAGTLIAVVGREPILLGDILDPKKLSPAQLSSPAFESHLRKSLTEKILKKAMAQRFIDGQLAGKSVKERSEAESKMRTKITQAFYDQILPTIMKEQKCESLDEFCDFLEKHGTTLSGLKENQIESILAQECIRDNVPSKPPIHLDEMSTYYEANQAEFEQPAKARFQLISAVFSKYPDREAAEKAIREMGNEVFFGTPFETVAKNKSSGMNAEKGGFFDWTSKGALKSKQIDDAVFSIEVNKLSQIITDATGFHIIRVLERNDAKLTTFADAQPTIKKKLIENKKKEAHKNFVEKVKAEALVWTKWPEDFPGSRPLSEIE